MDHPMLVLMLSITASTEYLIVVIQYDSYSYALRANVTRSNPIVVNPQLDVEVYLRAQTANIHDIPGSRRYTSNTKE